MGAGASSAWVWRHQGLLGTAVEIRIEGSSTGPEPGVDAEGAAEQVQSAVVAEMIRLESVFSVFDPRSELRRWRAGAVSDQEVGAELVALLSTAAAWHARSDGAFSPVTGGLVRRWRAAEAEGMAPTSEELQALADRGRQLPYRPLVSRPACHARPEGAAVEPTAAGSTAVEPTAGGSTAAGSTAAGATAGGSTAAEKTFERQTPDRTRPARVSVGGIERVGDCGDVDLNAIAKGRVVDTACAVAWASRDRDAGLASLMVNAGGDVRHVGDGTARVAVADPRRPQDNAPPLTVVALRNAALATSGPTRRGFRIGDRWYGHVVDPRNGHPVHGALSASALAGDCTTADAVATVLSVLPASAGVAFAAGLLGVGCCVLDESGGLWRNEVWEAAEIRPWSP